MNYLRIYNELIEHRKMLPVLDEVYYESHHILPLCQGGTDNPENLILLTAEDHFVAHLLLAKAYGGKLWFAAHLMSTSRQGDRKIRNRRAFGMIRKKHCEQLAVQATKTDVHTFLNRNTGETFQCTQTELREKYGLGHSQASMVVSGKRSAKGICIPSFKVKEIKKFQFIVLDTGETHLLTVSEAVDFFQVEKEGLSRITYRSSRTYKGISVVGRVMKPRKRK